MEEIIKILMGGSLTFIGLIFTSLGIILTIQDNWKTKILRESDEFKIFLSQNVWCVIYSIAIFLLSLIFLLVDNLYLTYLVFGTILSCTIFVCYYVIRIVISYKKLIELKSDNEKPDHSVKSCEEEED